MEQPSISVVIPAYNEELYLPKCLKALKQQNTRIPFETIVVNNNSQDSTRQIAAFFNARIIDEPKQGLIFAKQAGCDHARAELIAVLDADNIPPPSWIDLIYKLLQDPDISAATGPYLTPQAPLWAKVHNRLGISLINFWQLLSKSSPHIWGGNVAFRRKDFEKIGGYDLSYSFAADEIKLRKDLAKLGRIRHHRKLAVESSIRRYQKGFLYFYFNFLLKGYILNYALTTIFKKTLPHPENLRKE